MRPGRVPGLYRRRGSLISWEHAIPAQKDRVDPLTQTPRLSVGGRREVLGHFGERYHKPYIIEGYLQTKVATTFVEDYGIVDDRTLQLTVPALITPSVATGIVMPPRVIAEDYLHGVFVRYVKKELVARDRFTINGIRYIAKASAVPIIDTNRVLAWRIQLAADSL